MDNRLTRKMEKKEAEGWLAWRASAKEGIAEYVRVLQDEIDKSLEKSDAIENFTGNNCLATLAHQASRRDALRDVIKLLSYA